jgi:hypothetical protein
MNKFDLILRNIVFFLWPIPFLLGFAIEYHHWTAYVAYAAIVVLVLAVTLPPFLIQSELESRHG